MRERIPGETRSKSMGNSGDRLHLSSKWMLRCYLVTVFSLSVLSLTACTRPNDASTASAIRSHILHMLPRSPQESQVVPLYLSNRRMLAILRVGDSAPIPIVFDTGTSANLLDLKTAALLRLPRTGPSESVDGAGNPVPGYAMFVRNASLSGVPIPDGPATAIDYNQTDEVGIFGPNSFPGRLVRLEGPENRLSLLPIQSETLPPCKPFQYLGTGDDGLPSAMLEIGELKIPAILDTGNDSAIILPTEYIHQIPLEGAPTRIGYVYTAAGKQPLFGGRLNGILTIGSVRLDHPEIHFAKDGKPNIGFPILRALTVLMDPTGHRDWILSSDGRNTCKDE